MPNNLETKVDSVLVLGNSLPYVNSGYVEDPNYKTPNYEDAVSKLIESFQAFYEVLKPYCHLYVSVNKPYEGEIERDLGCVEVNGEEEIWRLKVSHDYPKCLRTWSIIREKKTGIPDALVTQGIIITPVTVKRWMSNAGFITEEIHFPEENYTVIHGYKYKK